MLIPRSNVATIERTSTPCPRCENELVLWVGHLLMIGADHQGGAVFGRPKVLVCVPCEGSPMQMITPEDLQN